MSLPPPRWYRPTLLAHGLIDEVRLYLSGVRRAQLVRAGTSVTMVTMSTLWLVRTQVAIEPSLVCSSVISKTLTS